VSELLTLVDPTSSAPAIDETAFPSTPSEWTWSSSAEVGAHGWVWGVDFDDGSSFTNNCCACSIAAKRSTGSNARSTVEIGYAIVRSHWGRRIATEAVRELLRRITSRTEVQRVLPHTPSTPPECARGREGGICIRSRGRGHPRR
jgi:RimJ/RimL family protein N-acetyltransferase